MPYTQVRDVLRSARQLHQDLLRFHGRVAGEAADERLELVTAYMGRHEGAFDVALEDCSPQMAEEVLETWLAADPLAGIGRAPIDELDPHLGVDALVEIALAIDDRLVALYRELAGSSASPRIRAVFRQLVELQGREEHRAARAALEHTLTT